MDLTEAHLNAAAQLRGSSDRSVQWVNQVLALYHQWPKADVPFPKDLEKRSLDIILESVRPWDGSAARRLIDLLIEDDQPVRREIQAKAYLFGPYDPGEAPRSLRRFAFLHVFKTGGTSLVDWMLPHLANYLSFVPPDPETFNRLVSCLDLQKVSCIRGHFNLYDANPYLRDGRALFTVVRRPDRQILSAIWMLLSEHLGALNVSNRIHLPFDEDLLNQHMKSSPISGFQARYRPQINHFLPPSKYLPELGTRSLFSRVKHRYHLKRLIAKTLDCFDVIGLTERLQDTARLIAWKLHWPAPPSLNHARQSHAGANHLSKALRSRFATYLLADDILYQEASKRFHRLFSRLIREAGGEENIDSFLNDNAR